MGHFLPNSIPGHHRRSFDMNNGVGVTDGVPTQKSSDEEHERGRFVCQNPGYGYGVVENTSASSSASTRTSSGISSFIDSSASIGSSAHPAIDVASSGRRIDLIRQSDFPRLLRPIAVSPTTPSGTPSGHQQHNQDHQWKKPGSMDAAKRDGALVYLDHAGATLFGASQLTEAMESLLGGVQGNPHSQVPPSLSCSSIAILYYIMLRCPLRRKRIMKCTDAGQTFQKFQLHRN